MTSNLSNITSSAGQLYCPWAGCGATTRPERLQDLRRHILLNHLPYSLFCPTPTCRWRGALRDEFKAHFKSCDPGNDREPCLIYDTRCSSAGGVCPAMLGLVPDKSRVILAICQSCLHLVGTKYDICCLFEAHVVDALRGRRNHSFFFVLRSKDVRWRAAGGPLELLQDPC
ncbi:hypothetical protein BJV78DRAFT_700243 [Lactifluus subvellereus]|nr:hypothetical protein BJV78DRAFT_700243 [Lactifluus subvellereus]